MSSLLQRSGADSPKIRFTLAVAAVCLSAYAFASPALAAPPQAPTLTLGTPSSSPTNITTASFALTNRVSGATFTCSLDSGAYTDCTPPLTLSGLTEGTHTYSVKQTANGQTSAASNTVSWTVDLTPPPTPTLARTSPTDAFSNLTDASFTFSANEAGGTLQCRLDSTNNNAFSTCTSPQSVTGLSDGIHRYFVRQVDDAGNPSATPAQTTWTVDTVAPLAPTLSSAPIAAAPGATTPLTYFNISWTAAEVGGSFQCSVDGGAYAACTNPKTGNNLSPGAHSLAVRQIDAAGNVGASATANWTVQVVVPTVTSDKPSPTGAQLQEPVVFTVNVAPVFSGTVTVKNGATVLGTCTLAAGTCSILPVNFSTSGNRSITAVYTYDLGAYNNASDPITQVVTPITANDPTLSSGSSGVLKGDQINSSGWSLSNVYSGANPYPTPAFQWQRCFTLNDASSCTDIADQGPGAGKDNGVNGASWGTRDNDIGRQLRLKVVWNTIEQVFTTYSGLSGLVSPQPAGPGTPPVLNFGAGNSHPVKNTTIKPSFGSWKGYVTGVTTVAYQWQRCTSTDPNSCSNVINATGGWYTPGNADVGQRLRLVMTINTRGQTASQASDISPVTTATATVARAAVRKHR